MLGLNRAEASNEYSFRKVRSDQLALDAGKSAVSRKRLLHDVGTGLERLQQVAMPALKVFQHVCQQAGCNLRIEGENAFDDMVGACLVGRVEIARFSGRLERAHDYPRGVGTQMERLTMQETGVRQEVLGSLEGKLELRRRWREAPPAVSR